MPTFEYQAESADGRVVNGRVFGTSMDQALRDLSNQGLMVMKIGAATNPNDPLAEFATVQAAPAVARAPVAAPARQAEIPRFEIPPEPAYEPSSSENRPVANEAPPTEQRTYMETSVWGPLVGQVPLTDVQFFFRQGATMLEAGVPIVQAFETLARQSKSHKFQVILSEIVGHIKEGRPISAGLQRYPEVFGPVVVSMIRAGEEGGFLDRAMAMIAQYLERDIALRNLYKRITFYPKLQVGASILIIVVTNMILASIGTSSRLSSPLTTPATWFILGPLLVFGFLLYRLGLANPSTKHTWDTMASNIPYVGATVRQLAMARFGRAFGCLYQGGVPLPKALKLSADSCGNEYLRARMYSAIGGLEQGHGIAETFRQTEAFNPIVLDMVGTGETTGNLDFMLNKMAEYYEGEAETRSTKTAQVTGVVIGLLVAIYIGFIVISFWSGQGAAVSSAVNEG